MRLVLPAIEGCWVLVAAAYPEHCGCEYPDAGDWAGQNTMSMPITHDQVLRAWVSTLN